MNEYGLADNFNYSYSDKNKLAEIKKNLKIFLKEINDRVDKSLIFLESDNDYEFYFGYKDDQDFEIMLISIGCIEEGIKPYIEIHKETYGEFENVVKLLDFLFMNCDEISEEIETLREYEDDEEYDEDQEDEY